MALVVRSPKELASGLLFMAFGAAFAVIGQGYEIGGTSRMGPGYFPLVLAGLLVLIGTAIAVRSLVVKGQPIGRFGGRGVLAILASVALFAISVRTLGLPFAVFFLATVGAAAMPTVRWQSALLLALLLAAFSVAVFVVALGLPIPVRGTLLIW